MKNLVTLFCCVLLFASCNNKQPDKASTQPTTPPVTLQQPVVAAGESVATVKTTSDTTQSYSLFVPSKIEGDTLLLVFFDPAANGKKPVEKYQALAEKHGIILAGSNDSKNGLSGEQSTAIAKKVLHDLRMRFSLNSKQIYASGFSGGARVAVLTAMGENLAGAIGCGGGFPGKVERSYGFEYVGVVGNTDFNFLEMKRLYTDLERVKMKHQLIVFDGKHEWCPVEQMEKAILLLKEDARSKELLAARIDSSVAVFKTEKDWIRLYDELRLGVTSGLDSVRIQPWREEMRALRKNEACVAALKQEAEIETKEAETQREIAKAFGTRDFAAITTKMKALQQESKKSEQQKLSDKRMLQFMSLMSFMYSEKALNSDAALTKKYLDVYSKVDSENPDYYFLTACYHVKLNDKAAAMTALKKSVELGLEDKEKIVKNPLLATLRSEAGFAELVQ